MDEPTPESRAQFIPMISTLAQDDASESVVPAGEECAETACDDAVKAAEIANASLDGTEAHSENG